MLEFYNSTRATSTESLNSTCVFFNRKMQKKGEKVVIRQQDTLLERLGYNVNDPDYIYLKDVVEEVIEGMDSRSEEEMRALVHNRSSYILKIIKEGLHKDNFIRYIRGIDYL